MRNKSAKLFHSGAGRRSHVDNQPDWDFAVVCLSAKYCVMKALAGDLAANSVQFADAGGPPQAAPRPPLKWAGGKRWQVPHLRELWRQHQHRRLVEPFCGGLAVTLALMPRRALLNDINP